MNTVSRTKNSVRNAGTALIGQFLNNILRFICRTVFIATLGKEYLGISSLYSNILTLLSISELGIGSAVTYSLYRPLASGDEEKVAALMGFFRKAYRIIGLVILILGLCLMPFLPKLMNGVTDKVNIYEYYLLYLIQTVVSYLFFSYKSILLTADQKKRVSDLISYGVQVSVNVIQILILVLWHNFFLYTLVFIFSNIVNNLLVARAVDRRYPYINQIHAGLSRAESRDVFRRVYAMFLYKISSAIGNATDNLLISSYISVVVVGLYDNYYMIIQIIQQVIKNIFGAFTSSLGNLYAVESSEKNYGIFRALNRLNEYIVVLCSVMFLVLFQPFITMWAGKDYLLSNGVLLIIVLNFETNYLNNIVQIYKDASGIFVRGKYRAVATAVLNLVISIILAERIGLSGIFLGSIIARLVTTTWFDAWLLYDQVFHRSVAEFYFQSVLSVAVTCLCAGGLLWLFPRISLDRVSAAAWLCRAVIAFAAVTLLYYIAYRKSAEYAVIREKAVHLLKR